MAFRVSTYIQPSSRVSSRRPLRPSAIRTKTTCRMSSASSGLGTRRAMNACRSCENSRQIASNVAGVASVVTICSLPVIVSPGGHAPQRLRQRRQSASQAALCSQTEFHRRGRSRKRQNGLFIPRGGCPPPLSSRPCRLRRRRARSRRLKCRGSLRWTRSAAARFGHEYDARARGTALRVGQVSSAQKRTMIDTEKGLDLRSR
jgi:hypothetical protein